MQQIPPEDWAENHLCRGIHEEEYHQGSYETLSHLAWYSIKNTGIVPIVNE